MKLHRIRIEQLRKFRQPKELSALTAGLNIVAGPNEAGKSTLVRALRAAFLERHRSSSVKDLQPHGDSSASPSIELQFEHGGHHYHLNKSFLGRKRCDLLIDGAQRLEGVEAEDHLGGWLGFGFALKGANAPENLGVPGLLWIEQGASQNIQSGVNHALHHLRKALSHDAGTGAVVSTAGDALLEQVKALRGELLTPQGAPKTGAALHMAQAQVKALGAELAVLNEHIDLHRQRVDELEALRTAHAVDETTRPWDDFQRQHDEAHQALQAIAALQTRQRADQATWEQLGQRQVLLQQQHDAWVRQAGERATRRRDGIASRERLAQVQARVQHLQSSHEACAHERLQALDEEQAARAHTEHQAWQAQRQQGQVRLDQVRHTLARARQEQSVVQSLLAERPPAPVAEAEATQLRQLAAKRRELAIHRRAIATRLTVSPSPGQSLVLGGRRLDEAGDHWLVQATTLDIPNWGQLHIQPGGVDVRALQDQTTVLARQWHDGCQRLGLQGTSEGIDGAGGAEDPDLARDEAVLAQMQARHQGWQAHQHALQLAQQSLRLQAPDGLEALLAQEQALVQQLHDSLQSPCAEPPSAEARPWPEARAHLRACEQRLQALTQQWHEARQDLSGAQAQQEAAQRECERLEALCGSPQQQALETANRQSMDQVRQDLAHLEESLARQAAEIAQAQPEALGIDVQRFGQSARQARERHAHRLDALIRLETTLHNEGAQGLEERRDTALAEQAHAARRHQELQHRADALTHLLKTLEQARQTLTLRLQAPLQSRMDHYLRLSFPQARLTLDEHLCPTVFQRGSVAAPQSDALTDLSFGAREQLGVMSRLAYADLLQAAGRPTLIILDDALVHTDASRMQHMKRVLLDAAQRHQILLFTCHPEGWQDMGVEVRTL